MIYQVVNSKYFNQILVIINHFPHQHGWVDATASQNQNHLLSPVIFIYIIPIKALLYKLQLIKRFFLTRIIN